MNRNHVLSIVLCLHTALMAPEARAQALKGFTVHEWGTFTSFQGSDGRIQEGMHHEEENLPGFVGGRAVFGEVPPASDSPAWSGEPHPRPQPTHRPCGKCFEMATPAGTALAATQKMETPVLYFYAPAEMHASVDVAFPKGIISQYYPAPVKFSPPIGQVSTLSGGNTHFEIDVTKKPLPLPIVPAGSVYAPARNVSSDYVKTAADENEKFIFYRGLGNFTTDVKVSSTDGGLTITNLSKRNIPALFAVYVGENGGSVLPLGGLGIGKNPQAGLQISKGRIFMMKTYQSPQAEFQAEASRELVSALVESGLFKDEAQAMVDTWKNSYFKTRGLRVLYVLNRAETDNLLPIQISPQPEALVRTLVGRLEVMTEVEERDALARIDAGQGDALLAEFGRIAEPKLRRLSQIATGDTSAKVEALLRKAIVE